MKVTIAIAILVAGCATTEAVHAPTAPAAKMKQALEYPPSRREAVKDVLHGVEVSDPYRWLEDEKSPEVKAWMAQQDGLARAQLAKFGDREA